MPASVRLKVTIADAQGQPVDELEVKANAAAVEPFGPVRASTGERLRHAAEEAAKLVARYLRERAGLAAK
jgi:hypothetical protein